MSDLSLATYFFSDDILFNRISYINFVRNAWLQMHYHKNISICDHSSFYIEGHLNENNSLW